MAQAPLTDQTSDDAIALAAALDRVQAVIQFDLDGTVVEANRNFLHVMGYQQAEIVGQHHRMFCTDEMVRSDEYRAFWDRLRAGEFVTGEVRRVHRSGAEVWLQATYTPILGADGRPTKVMKFASDVTADKLRNVEYLGKVTAIDRSQAVIEFELDGTIITANRNFCDAIGYSLAEIEGKHHRIFVESDYAESDEYDDFWSRLGAGEFYSDEFERVHKDGSTMWLQATYNPVLDADGEPLKVVKFASDITKQKRQTTEYLGKVTAIDRSQAVIEFELDGTIITANRNFCATVGYDSSEIIGQHHRMFVGDDDAQSEEYRRFWERLRDGEFFSGEYKRKHSDGSEIWLQASYNPILDAEGEPYKVVKFASDVTKQAQQSAEHLGKINALDRSQAVIEFDVEGHVMHANENFLHAMGYPLREIVGQHHSIFCDEQHVRSTEYRDHWMKLSKGEFLSGRFHRKGKFGRDVHIQASYNPILDRSGEVVKIVKFAFDITDQVQREQLIAEHTSAMTTAVSELSDSIDAIATCSSLANSHADETRTTVSDGAAALRDAVEAIDLMHDASERMAAIVGTMAEIANQTNLLAFNASIEAARAAEHGVGFSIVAGEVRKLAERSADAAQQIGQLINETAERVRDGSEVSGRAEGAFDRIAELVGSTNDAIVSIASATDVQINASTAVRDLIDRIAENDAA